MKFSKDNQPIKKGRTKGSPNKNTAQIRAAFAEIVEGNTEQLKADLKAMKPTERANIIIQMAKYVIPTLKSVDATVSKAATATPVLIELN